MGAVRNNPKVSNMRVKIIRQEWPAVIEANGRFFEEEYDIDRNEDSFQEVSRAYLVVRGIISNEKD